jgi:hypothetical protein
VALPGDESRETLVPFSSVPAFAIIHHRLFPFPSRHSFALPDRLGYVVIIAADCDEQASCDARLCRWNYGKTANSTPQSETSEPQ